MRFISHLLLFAFLGLNLACSDLILHQKSLKNFATDFERANLEEDMEALLNLFDRANMDTKDLTVLQTALSFEIGLPIERIYFQTLSGAPEETIAYEKGGTAYRGSLAPKYRMVVDYDTRGGLRSKFTLGLNNNRDWKIITAVPNIKK
ncbi:MAG: hypothetical protein DBX03_02470 [Puniceicoccaceae bacterium]|nr:MAG: hypothetical protein DBX03_02470 [Puniceicoccaceae bacterium]|tara:strand:+ start:495 stop:938 length:444 start_codon:yes stop_codon:yes gene_type:complete